MSKLQPGFDNPVFQSQQIFTKIMLAMARPAEPVMLKKCCEGPGVIHPSTAALGLTLFDHEIKVHLGKGDLKCMDWLRFHCGVHIVEQADLADFIIIDGQTDQKLTMLIGSPEYPDRSATLIIEVETFNNGTEFIARGPGIKDKTEFSVHGLAENLEKKITENEGLFPQGFDTILVSPDSIICLPRTTKLEKK
ncbi:MAG: phosphonate C-P lyase system protein PhnH [Desulfotalea sp.]